MAPSGLNHADFRVGEKLDGALQQIRPRNKVGIQNTNEFAFGRFQPGGQRTGLETGPLEPMN